MESQTQVIIVRDGSVEARAKASVLKNRSGLYILAFNLLDKPSLSVGKLGRFMFPPGYYQYIGSACKGVRSRVRRHLEKRKIRHWHLDYFMPHVSVIGVHAFYEPTFSECELADQTESSESGLRFPPRFGASDCRCGGHLIRHESPPVWLR